MYLTSFISSNRVFFAFVFFADAEPTGAHVPRTRIGGRIQHQPYCVEALAGRLIDCMMD